MGHLCDNLINLCKQPGDDVLLTLVISAQVAEFYLDIVKKALVCTRQSNPLLIVFFEVRKLQLSVLLHLLVNHRYEMCEFSLEILFFSHFVRNLSFIPVEGIVVIISKGYLLLHLIYVKTKLLQSSPLFLLGLVLRRIAERLWGDDTWEQ